MSRYLSACVIIPCRFADIVSVELDELSQISTDRKRLTRVYITVDGNRALTARSDCVDYEFLSGVNVSANEDVRLSRLICDRVGLDGLVPVEFNLCSLEERLMVGLLAYTEYDIFTLDRLCLRIVELRIESSFAVLDAQALSEVDAADLAFFVLSISVWPQPAWSLMPSLSQSSWSSPPIGISSYDSRQ